MTAGSEDFGPYVVYERLGQGGMATVHRAEKRGVGFRRPVALKRLLPHVAADPDLVKLFVDEARLASHLHHANVAQTFELGKIGETFFIAMEYAPGPTLTQVIRQSQKTTGEIPLPITVNILSQICEALDYAHNLCDETGKHLRIIHRDVSPANIIVANSGVVKLIDFGIAKTALSSVKTQTGFIKGKFGYIAPEYITGKIDKRVDLFAVGVVAHEMLAGRRLFEGKDDFETLANIRDMVMKPPSHWNAHVTPDLDDIVMTALARDPDQRWQSAAAMHVALQNAAKEFGLPVGGPQLTEWVEWAFALPAPGDDAEEDDDDPPDDDDEDGLAEPPGRAPGSSISIEMSRLPADAVTPRPELLRRRAASDAEHTAMLNPRRAMAAAQAPRAAQAELASESFETLPRSRLSAAELSSDSFEGLPLDRSRLSDMMTPRFNRPELDTPATPPPSIVGTPRATPRAATVAGRSVNVARGDIDLEDDDAVETRALSSVAPPVLREVDTESLDETRQVDVVVPPPAAHVEDPIAPPPRATPRPGHDSGLARARDATPRSARETGPSQAPRSARETGPSQAPRSAREPGPSQPPRSARETGPSQAPRSARETGPSQPPRSARETGPSQPPRSARETGPSQAPRSARETGPSPRAREVDAAARVSKQVASAALPPRSPRETAPPPLPRTARETSPPPIPTRPAGEASPPSVPIRTARDSAPPRSPTRESSPPPPIPVRPGRESGPPARPSAAALGASPSAMVPMPPPMSGDGPAARPTLTPTPAPLPSPPLPGLAAASRQSPTSYDVDMLTPTPIPTTPGRPALPFSGAGRPSRQLDAVAPSTSPASSGPMPRAADASILPSPPRGAAVIIVPPGNLFEEPRPAAPADAPKQKVKNRRAKKSQPEAAVAAPGSGPAAVQSTGTAVLPTVAPPARRKRRVFWMVLWLVILGGGAMAAAYYWPDLQGLIDQISAWISG